MLDFPGSPAVGDVFGNGWRWDGTKWASIGGAGTDAPSDANYYGRHQATWGQVLPLIGGTLSGNLNIDAASGYGTAVLGAKQTYFQGAPPGNAQIGLVGGAEFLDLTAAVANFSGSISVPATATAAYLHSTGGVLSDSGTFYANTSGSGYYLQRSTSDGWWRFVENGTTTFSITPGGAVTAEGSVTGTFLHSTGALQIDSNAIVSGSVTTAWLHSTGEVAADTDLKSNNGTFYATNAGAYYLQRYSGDGVWRFVENGTTTFSIDPAGNAGCPTFQTTSGSVSALWVNNGGNIRLEQNGNGVSMYLRANAASPWGMEFVNNAYNAVVANLDDGGNFHANGNVAGAYLHSTGTVRADGALSAGGDVSVGGNVWCQAVYASGGLFQVAANYYLQRGSDGAWRFVENGTVNFTIDNGGNATARAGLYASGTVQGNWLYSTGSMQINGSATINGGLNTGGNTSVGAAVYIGANAVGDCFLTADTANKYWQFRSDGWKILWSNSSGAFVFFNGGGAGMFQIDAVGNLYVPGNVSAANVSDARTKRAVAPFRRGLADLIKLEPVSYEHNGLGGTTDDGTTRWGVIAQDAQKHIPECVHATPEPPPDPTRDEAPTKLRLDGQLSVNEQPLLYAMINAFRDVAVELEQMSARLAVLESHR
jgi:cytoskeletal protein CcmA (bactofilin family)